MTNQWGRNSSSSATRKSPGVVFPVVISLLLGASGGYAGARFFDAGAATGIAGFTRERDDLRQELQARSSEIADLNARLSAAQTLSATAQQQDQDLAAARTEVDTIRAQRDRLEQDMKRQAEELDGLTEKLASSSSTTSTGTADLAAARVRNAQLVRDLDAARTAGLAAEDRITASRKDADGLRKIISNAQGENAALKADIADMRAQKLDSDRQVVQMQAEITRLSRTQVSPAKPVAEDAGNTQSPPQSPDPVSALVPRPQETVDTALDRSPGLQGLSQSDRQTLKQKLLAGECVTVSLEAVFERVPVIALRNLIRDLKSGC